MTRVRPHTHTYTVHTENHHPPSPSSPHQTDRAPVASNASQDYPTDMGRPSLYTDEILTTICEGLEQGIPLTVICAGDDMPAPRTVMDWQANDPAISAAIGRAREAGEFALAEQCLAISEEREGRAIMADGSEVAVVFDSTAIQRNKLRIDTRLKLLAKFNPKRWGDKLELAGNAEQPLQVLIQRKSDPEPQA